MCKQSSRSTCKQSGLDKRRPPLRTLGERALTDRRSQSGDDAHIAPANKPVFTEISGEFDGTLGAM